MHVLLLADGNTWGRLSGCKILHFPDSLSAETIDQRVEQGRVRVCYTFDGDEDGGTHTPVIPPEVAQLDGYDLQLEAARAIGEDKIDRATLEEIVVQGGGVGIDL